VVGFLARPVLEEIIGSGGGKVDTLAVLQNSEKMYAEILESYAFIFLYSKNLRNYASYRRLFMREDYIPLFSRTVC
jgi:hypothetical protein